MCMYTSDGTSEAGVDSARIRACEKAPEPAAAQQSANSLPKPARTAPCAKQASTPRGGGSVKSKKRPGSGAILSSAKKQAKKPRTAEEKADGGAKAE